MYKLASFSAVIFFLFILYIIHLANSGNSALFEFVRSIPYGDKIGHCVIFGTLTFFVVFASKFRFFRLGKLSVYYGTAAITLFVIAEEISQMFIPSRTFDWIDLSADFVGILSASTLAYLSSRAMNRGTEQEASKFSS